MSEIVVKYGRGSIALDFDDDCFDVLVQDREQRALSDIELAQRFDHPIDSRQLEDLVRADDSVLLVVPDATRRAATGQLANLVVRRLIAAGVAPFKLSIIFATGIHRRVTDQEKRELLTPFIHQRIKTLDHDARDLARIVKVGETGSGAPVELNRALTEFDHVIIVGGVTFHYFAGFTGGRKLICPGLASSRTVSATHKLAFDCETMTRRKGVGTGQLDGNPVHEAFVEATSNVNPRFALNAVVNDEGDATDLFCGDWITSHRAACDAYDAANTISIGERRDIVVVSCGGFPHDINMIQAHKALEAASHACREGGTILLLAECADGPGRADYLDWFAAKNSAELAQRLCEKYQVNGQTAWNQLRIAERFDVKMVTNLSEDETSLMRSEKIAVDDIRSMLRGSSGYILPYGAGQFIKQV